MAGTKFVLDEEKVLREGKYDLEAMYRFIDEVAKRAQLQKIAKNHYVFVGEDDLAYLGIFVFNHMSKCEWFTANLISWTWMDEDGEDDLIALLKGRNKGVWG